MEVDPSRLIEKTLCPGDSFDSLYSNDTTFITYYLKPDLKEEDEELRPIRLIRKLNQNRVQIQKFIPKLIDTDFLKMEQVKENEPFYGNRPRIVETGYTYIAFNISSTTCGMSSGIGIKSTMSNWFYATNNTLFYYENNILMNKTTGSQDYYPFGFNNMNPQIDTYELFNHSPLFNASAVQISKGRRLEVLKYSNITLSNRFPTSFQLMKHLDQVNQLSDILFDVSITAANLNNTVNITNLKANTVYNIYITFANSNPIPVLLSNQYVAQLNVKTKRLIRKVTRPFEHI